MGIGDLLFVSPAPLGEGQRDLGACSLVAAGWGLSALLYAAKLHPSPSPEGEELRC
ncbi:hypothetical protein SKP52_16290 [Sphingopyxis fribergensis]|uniref:Uncharacterized protein n=1 Tax=Sphingopyxis fribergensis TaxID=1515612 RepID=A0A0A7PQA6_9SPHN|nr:hypothetical protein SKP52_16290 [Sphingopyxis fribergensis]